ncbi:hypothetical protein CH063_13470 [Colletotrichum higginsianum]|uniref:Uncharacterized protein n=4 Tax=Colletotrichum destructivum species complex TaxID=2707350 RepID=H1VUJ3_COLHI|nr:hypothetical protein CH63R_00577 [Colletotrichum higginsianum IMI 349063]TID03736.1 hypothetical protein CH35J_002805 [Colletotrichum higginsianum]TQN71531.1 hypothetical protein CSHISOI_04002 [Colletotrichum shisoi]WQF77767.1 hypothetical protein CDEST_02781 [Colletotrichum destructivum]OBR15397.1 hypothetical protein CH63R_00577 [Colletotrichum higginsianum IMI 349063]CCF43902.1 hypothetical protein CH063_13470 [Colletotrichum higginsianum]
MAANEEDFTPYDPVRCAHYARFAAHLDRWQFDLLYWLLFVFNLFILFLAAWNYTRTLDAVSELPETDAKRKKAIKRCIYFNLFCVCVSLATVIMEVFTLMALQFCDGEDLMSLYWSTFTMIQVGSLIAVCGVILALVHQLRQRKHPPWALALGTPVLVIAGLFHYFHMCMAQRVKKATSRKRKNSDAGTLPMSQVNTIQVESSDEEDGIQGAEIIGLTMDGGPIIHFKDAVPYNLPDSSEIIGRCENDKPIVICRRDGFQLIYNGQDERTPSPNPATKRTG